ncbi:MAG: hypothetical protein ABJH72_15435 [Reichenbachiella sp.]|uniref:hypothetical protein n=1 Tax=Reichenbachiella sp. TaxID=2184521 RepID=UPI003266E465
MKNLKIYTLLLVSAFVAFSCDEEDKLITDILTENPLPGETDFAGDAGSLDLSVYVSLGASITGGTMDNALYSHGQANSFPALLARQFAAEGGGAFNQPDINSVNGFSGVDGTTIGGKLILDLDLNNDGVLGDAGIVTSEGEVPGAYTGDKETLNNFGVPGIQTAQMLTPLTGGPDDVANPAYNALYARFASEPGVSTILGDAVARNPTFFTLWPGGNDVLGYATGGGVNEAILTAPATVSGSIDALLAGLMAGGAKGVIINVPNILALPFFQAVPYNAIPMTDEASVTAANTAYEAYNAGVQGALANMIIDADEAAERTISYAIGGNAIVIEDPDLTDVATLSGGAIPIPKYRQLAADEIVTLPASTILGTLADPNDATSVIGVGVPLDDAYSLRDDELAKIVANLTEINTKIATVAATTDGLVHFDALTVLQTIAVGGGYNTGSFTLLPDFSPNGIFSNDGVHPNSRGSAILANEIIKVLETEFGATIEPLDVMQFNSSPFQQ